MEHVKRKDLNGVVLITRIERNEKQSIGLNIELFSNVLNYV